MRTVIILSFLALVTVSTAAFCADPLKVGGDFGTAWLENLPYQPEVSSEENESGLWSWGGAPIGKQLVNSTLEPVENNTEEIDYAGIGWLGAEPLGPPEQINYTNAPLDYMYPFYSDDPWILAQHYGRPVRTNLHDLPDSIRSTIDL